MPRQKTLNARQLKFCQLFTSGETAGNIAQSHRKAGYICPTIEGHGANGIRVLKSERIQKEIAKLREKAFAKSVLSFSEKRNFLARVVRADASNPDADLVQEMREEVDAEGNVKRTRKIVSKIDAIRADNNMAGDNFVDKHQASENPFLLLVTLSQADAHKAIQRESTRALPALPAQEQGEVIEAEVTPAE